MTTKRGKLRFAKTSITKKTGPTSSLISWSSRIHSWQTRTYSHPSRSRWTKVVSCSSTWAGCALGVTFSLLSTIKEARFSTMTTNTVSGSSNSKWQAYVRAAKRFKTSMCMRCLLGFAMKKYLSPSSLGTQRQCIEPSTSRSTSFSHGRKIMRRFTSAAGNTTWRLCLFKTLCCQSKTIWRIASTHWGRSTTANSSASIITCKLTQSSIPVSMPTVCATSLSTCWTSRTSTSKKWTWSWQAYRVMTSAGKRETSRWLQSCAACHSHTGKTRNPMDSIGPCSLR